MSANIDEGQEQFEKQTEQTVSNNVKAGNLKKGDYILINNKTYKVTDISCRKTGKHGHAKANITGYDVFNGSKFEKSLPGDTAVEMPVISRKIYQFIGFSDEHLQLLEPETGKLREDLKWDNVFTLDEINNFMTEVHEGNNTVEITVMKAAGVEMIEKTVRKKAN